MLCWRTACQNIVNEASLAPQVDLRIARNVTSGCCKGLQFRAISLGFLCDTLDMQGVVGLLCDGANKNSSHTCDDSM